MNQIFKLDHFSFEKLFHFSSYLFWFCLKVSNVYLHKWTLWHWKMQDMGIIKSSSHNVQTLQRCLYEACNNSHSFHITWPFMRNVKIIKSLRFFKHKEDHNLIVKVKFKENLMKKIFKKYIDKKTLWIVNDKQQLSYSLKGDKKL